MGSRFISIFGRVPPLHTLSPLPYSLPFPPLLSENQARRSIVWITANAITI